MRLLNKEIVKANKLKKSMSQPFFDANNPYRNYSELNTTNVPDAVEIREYQLQKITSYHEFALGRKLENQNKDFNDLFLTGTVNTLTLENGESLELDKTISKVVGTMNDIWKTSINGKNDKYLKMQEQIASLNNSLLILQNQLKIKSVVYQNILDKIKIIMQSCDLNSLNKNEVQSWVNNLNRLKGEVVEELGTAWLKEKIPDFNSITTGSLELRNIHNNQSWKPAHGASPGQLIQDILILNPLDLNVLNDIEITYRLNNEIKTVSLGEFLDTLEAHNESGHIALDDNSYDTLLKLSALNIQAKAGFYQLPWNAKSKNTQVSINEFIDEFSGIVKPKHVFGLLHDLDNTEETKDWLYDTHDDYNAMANYGLSTVLYKTLHLSEYGNQMLLTPQGFVSFPQRLAYLLKNENDYIQIATRVHVNKNTLNNKYKVTLLRGSNK